MHIFRYTSVLTSLIVCACTYTVPDATVELIKPKGFRISIPHEDGITGVSFNLKIDQRIALYQPGDFAATVTELTNDRWAFDNINTSIKPGSQINYWIHVQFGELGKNIRDVGSAIVSTDSVEISAFCTDAAQPASTTNCEPSVTTVAGKSVCKDQLIFEDNFDTLNTKIWNQEVRLPIAADDGQFVSFQNRMENCYTRNGELYIVPSLLSEIHDEKSNQLDLEVRCTGTTDRSQECKRRAQYFQILPPIVSGRIRTKYSFSFRYGRVEIRAKLPKADWLFPLLLLEPLENYYGITGYASGQIRIAFNRGNDVLEDKTGRDISNKWLSGGVVLSNTEDLRSAYLRRRNVELDLTNFHNFTLTWNDQQLVLGVDGNDYAVIKENFSLIRSRFHGYTDSNNKIAPFDREFFLTLGVSAGGHSDFPDGSRNGPLRTPKPWVNRDPKAELNFWKDRANWSKTLKQDHALHVDYVRVYAL